MYRPAALACQTSISCPATGKLTVHDASGDDDPLTDGLAVVLNGQVGFQGMHVPLPEGRAPQLDLFRIGVVEALGGVAQQGAAIGREGQPSSCLLGPAVSQCVLVLLMDLADLRGHLILRRCGSVGIGVGDDVMCLTAPLVGPLVIVLTVSVSELDHCDCLFIQQDAPMRRGRPQPPRLC